jgi:hypothetical protein
MSRPGADIPEKAGTDLDSAVEDELAIDAHLQFAAAFFRTPGRTTRHKLVDAVVSGSIR